MKMSLPKFVFACRVHNSIDHRHTHTREKERQQKSGIFVTHTAHLRNLFYFSQVHCAQTWFAFVHFSFAENLWLSFFRIVRFACNQAQLLDEQIIFYVDVYCTYYTNRIVTKKICMRKLHDIAVQSSLLSFGLIRISIQ